MPLRLVPSIHRATHRIGLYLSDAGDDGLSQGEAHILALLASAAPATIADLHRGLAHKRSTLTSILDRLADRGFITRTVGIEDRRTFLIAPTARGRAVAARVKRHLADLELAVARRVTAADVAAFLKVVAAVEEEAHARTRRRAADRAAGRRRKGIAARGRSRA
ncbi:MAG TPA: MarR family transcriptional regulator [Vicinamibacterales bacterium]|nr:MarR family transcriptional regulator [Vicinamibacterales bacterium]